MHTLSFLPQLFFLAPFGYVIIRGTLAALLFVSVKEQWSPTAPTTMRLLIGVEGITALALTVGFASQIAAMAALLICICWIAIPRTRPYPLSTILLAVVMTIIIIIGGAGPLAIDLPL